MSTDLIQEYLAYTKETEPHIIYHRWCVMATIGALLGRNCYVPFGLSSRIFPNLYTMLIGEPGTRKSTAIKISKKLAGHAGYTNIGADKTSQEKFLIDLEGIEDEEAGYPGAGSTFTAKSRYSDSITAKALFGDLPDREEPKEVFIVADEFNEFAGAGNIDFYSLLGNLWDWDDPVTPYKRRLKTSRSVSIFQPTISILGGNTTENFSRAFPPEIIGQGFLSRLILIHGEQSGRKYFKPKAPPEAETAKMVQAFRNVRAWTRGEVSFTPSADGVLESIYNDWPASNDYRFKGYDGRRYTQLLKLALILSASRSEVTITKECIIEANTVLAAADRNMSRALGEFGLSRTSETADKLIAVLEKAEKALQIQELWTVVQRDLEKVEQLVTIMHGLVAADKAQHIVGVGYLIKKEVQKELPFVDFDRYLSQEERNML